jgi:hypothetical protein
MSRPIRFAHRRLPNGLPDALRQVLLFAVAYGLYQLVRGLVHGERALAFANTQHIVHIERSLGAFFEPGLQQAMMTHRWIIDFADFMYLNSHFILTTSFLIWLYMRRNENFYFVRNMFMVAMGLALVGYALFPAAPPRVLPSLGFTDTVAAVAHVNDNSSISSVFVNQYAAVPSMHIAFALLIGVPGSLLCRSLGARLWWSAYPMLVFFVIVVTANHFWFDAACGAAVACMAAVAAGQLARARPEAWGWREPQGEIAA